MPPIYPELNLNILMEMAWSGMTRNRRSFRQDALHLSTDLPLKVQGIENIPLTGPALIVMNHYHRPGFQAFWISLAISAVVPAEIHWTMTGAWTNDGTPGAWLRALLSPHILPRLARLYGFTSMPPMPPRPFETAAGAASVRHLLGAARQKPAPILGLAPEGQDNPTGGLMRPHPGVGRLLALIAGMGYLFIPVGVVEDDRHLWLNFGSGFHLTIPAGLPPDELDHTAADQVMHSIARLLPGELRGIYPNLGIAASR